MRITGAQDNRKRFLHFIDLVIHKRDAPAFGDWVTRRHDQLHWCGSEVKVGWRDRGRKGEERGRGGKKGTKEEGRGGRERREGEEERRGRRREGEERGRGGKKGMKEEGRGGRERREGEEERGRGEEGGREERKEDREGNVINHQRRNRKGVKTCLCSVGSTVLSQIPQNI